MNEEQTNNGNSCCLTTATLTAYSGSNNDTQGGTKVTKSSTSKPKINYYKIGDTVKVDKVENTLKSAVITSERNQFEDSKAKNIIKITYMQ